MSPKRMCPLPASSLSSSEFWAPKKRHKGFLPKARDGGKHMAHCRIGWGGRKVLPHTSIWADWAYGNGFRSLTLAELPGIPQEIQETIWKAVSLEDWCLIFTCCFPIRPWWIKAQGGCVTWTASAHGAHIWSVWYRHHGREVGSVVQVGCYTFGPCHCNSFAAYTVFS